jgi:hypothetical protein
MGKFEGFLNTNNNSGFSKYGKKNLIGLGIISGFSRMACAL